STARKTHSVSLHDALPISCRDDEEHQESRDALAVHRGTRGPEVQPLSPDHRDIRQVLETRGDRERSAHHSIVTSSIIARLSLWRSEEHTSELQSPDHLVCR